MTENGTELPDEVRQALDAYRQMGKTKAEYFGYLQELDEKYPPGGSPTIAENLKLEKLLKAHDEKVNAFNMAMQAVTGEDAREILLKKLGEQSMPGLH